MWLRCQSWNNVTRARAGNASTASRSRKFHGSGGFTLIAVVLLFCVAGLFTVNADPASNSLSGSPSRLPPLPPASSNYRIGANLNTNGAGIFAASVTNDAREVFLRHLIADAERNLENTNLDARLRPVIESQLRQHRMELTNYEEQRKEDAEQKRKFQEALRANPRTAWTNMPDPLENSLRASIRRYESELSDPGLAANVRETDERSLAVLNQQLAERATNVQLWANLRLGIENDNSAQIDEAKKHLASFLAKRLGDTQGKQYPTNLSYDAVIALYQKASGTSSPTVDRRKIVISALVLAAVVPIVIVGSRMFKRCRT